MKQFSNKYNVLTHMSTSTSLRVVHWYLLYTCYFSCWCHVHYFRHGNGYQNLKNIIRNCKTYVKWLDQPQH